MENNPNDSQPDSEMDANSNKDMPMGTQAVESEPEPTPPSMAAQPYIVPPKSSKKPLIFFIVFVFVVVFGLIAYYFAMTNTPKKQEGVLSSPTPAPALNAKTTIAQIKALSPFNGTLLDVAKTGTDYGETSNGMTVYGIDPYQSEGMDFATFPQESFGTGTKGDAEATAADYKVFSKFLENHKFTLTGSREGEPGEVGITNATYESDSTICSVVNLDLTETNSTFVAGIGCADISSYNAAATAIKPLGTALTSSPSWEADSPANKTLVLSGLKISDGADGHKNASLTISRVGAASSAGQGLFYQEPDKDWVFLKLTQDQDGLYCSDITTEAIKKSFTGQTCYDMTMQKTANVEALAVSTEE